MLLRRVLCLTMTRWFLRLATWASLTGVVRRHFKYPSSPAYIQALKRTCPSLDPRLIYLILISELP